jgi:hypothetical protein
MASSTGRDAAAMPPPPPPGAGPNLQQGGYVDSVAHSSLAAREALTQMQASGGRDPGAPPLASLWGGCVWIVGPVL